MTSQHNLKVTPELLALLKSKILLPFGKMPTLRREIGFMYRLPRFYGVAWTEWERPVVVAYPVPLNLIARAMRWLWHGMAFRYRPAKWEELLADSYRRGYEDGRKHGFRGYLP